jgi:hypothetical protein
MYCMQWQMHSLARGQRINLAESNRWAVGTLPGVASAMDGRTTGSMTPGNECLRLGPTCS